MANSRYAFFLLILLIFPGNHWSVDGWAATMVSGWVTGVWNTNGSPYLVEGGIAIRQGECLRIEPGVQVRFLDAYPFHVYGRLCAAGTPENMITFTPHVSSPAPWQGIRFFPRRRAALWTTVI